MLKQMYLGVMSCGKWREYLLVFGVKPAVFAHVFCSGRCVLCIDREGFPRLHALVHTVFAQSIPMVRA